MSTYQAATGITIQASFQKFHAENPHVFKLIVQEADKKFREKKKFSVKEIVNSLRWNKYFETKESNLFEVAGEVKKFKIGDQYISRYSRLLVNQYPYMADFIEMRRIRSL